MNLGQYNESLRSGIKLAKKFDLIRDINEQKLHNSSFVKYSRNFKDEMYSDNYLKIYNIILSNLDYDIGTKDGSFFQFSMDKTSRHNLTIRYAFYPSPSSILSYEDFLKKYYEVTIDDVGYSFHDDYEQTQWENTLSYSITPIRYDYSHDQYKKFVHPISHLHVGFAEDLRFPLNMVLLPESFIGIALSYINSTGWIESMREDCEIKAIYLSMKSKCINSHSNLLDEDEKNLFYFS